MANGLKIKKDRFERIVPPRVTKVLEAMRILSHCSDPNTYAYSQKQAKAVIDRVKSSVEQLERRYIKQAPSSRFVLPK